MSEKELIDIQRCADILNVQRVDAIVAGIELLKEKLNIKKNS